MIIANMNERSEEAATRQHFDQRRTEGHAWLPIAVASASLSLSSRPPRSRPRPRAPAHTPSACRRACSADLAPHLCPCRHRSCCATSLALGCQELGGKRGSGARAGELAGIYVYEYMHCTICAIMSLCIISMYSYAFTRTCTRRLP